MVLDSLKNSRLIAHRGASAYAPENTLVAMRRAHAMGARWVEFDVMLAGDGTPIVMHDDHLSRTTNGSGWVVDTAYKKIKTLDAGGWFGVDFRGETVPTLAELLHCLLALDMDINIEIKPTKGKAAATASRTLEVLFEHWPCESKPPLISSQDLACLQVVHQRAPELALAIVIHEWHEDWQAWVEDYDCMAIAVNHRILNRDMLTFVKEIVPLVIAYTVNRTARAETLFEWGVDAVFSDYPDLLAQSE